MTLYSHRYKRFINKLDENGQHHQHIYVAVIAKNSNVMNTDICKKGSKSVIVNLLPLTIIILYIEDL